MNNSEQRITCFVCNKKKFERHFTDVDDRLCTACFEKRKPECKCMSCGSMYFNKYKNKFGVCPRCKKTDNYSDGEIMFEVIR